MAASATASHGSSRLRRCIIAIEGVVQGIGFRPAVYRLAVRHGLGGSVRNSLQGVLVDVEGDATVIASFVAELDALAPGNRRRASITWQEPRGRASAFTVDASLRSPLGAEGQFWFGDLTVGKHAARVEFRDGTCRFEMEVPAGAGTVVNLGTVSCAGGQVALEGDPR